MKFEPLDSKKHDRKNFNCGVEILNLYLAKFANQDHQRDLTRTFVLAEEEQIVGYYSLSAHSVSRSNLPDHIKVGGYGDIPFLLLGRLAVDKRYQRKGFGDALIFDAFTKTSDLANIIGIYGMIVDSLSADATRFYEGFGFKKLSSHTNRLFLPMRTITKLLKQVSL